MIVNLVDSSVGMPHGRVGAVTWNVLWHVDVQLPVSELRNLRLGGIDLMRVIAPHRDVGLLIGLLTQALPSFKALFAPHGFIEIYGRRALDAIGESRSPGAAMTGGGALGADRLSTISGSLGRDDLHAIGRSLRPGDRFGTTGGSLGVDLLWAVAGAERICVRP